jgi:FkbM family methyltransferase
MKRMIARLADTLGYAVVPKWRIPDLVMAARLQSIFADFSIDTVIDVGANEGQYRNFLRDVVGFAGKIESFEPIPELAERLKARAASDRLWSIHACALGAEVAELTINIMSGTDFSSFRSPKPVHNTNLDQKNTVEKTARVPVDTLDGEFFGKRDLRHSFLKLDTQGYDLEVLRGGKQCISQIPALQTEVSFRSLYDGMPHYTESIAEFERNGFSVADLFLVSTDGEHRAMEFDCLMVRGA